MKQQLSLLENACDYLDDTILRVASQDPAAWKYAILSLASALELIMKSILEREHWSLLFQDVNSASEGALVLGDFKSVDFETAQKRLQSIAGVEISDRDQKYLKSLRNIRNKLSHYTLHINIEQLQSLVASGILTFLDLYSDPHLEDDHDEDFEAKANQNLREFEKYVHLRMAKLRSELRESERPGRPFQRCPDCDQDAVIFSETRDAKCLYCGQHIDLRALAKHTSEGPLEECPECGEDSLAFILYSNEEAEFSCASCSFSSPRLNRS
jgi:ribosomal protein S27E